jgi:cell division protein FtsW (lipid II flippase)
MTLPFVSYGGSSLVALWATTGVLFAIASRRARGFDLDA